MNKEAIIVDNNRYELIENYRDAFDLEEFTKYCTDYFFNYDYIVGDIAYSKLRLKGFYDPANKKVKNVNNYMNLSKYLKKNCANDCKYFVVKKIK